MNYELTYRHIEDPSQDEGKNRHLFETAFPPEERPSFEVLLGFEKARFYEVTHQGTFVGIVVNVEYRDLLYLFFLAVDPSQRRKGYGHQIVMDVKSFYPNRRIFLLADDPAPEYPDYQTRLDRIAFYQGCGLRLTETKIVELGVEYRMLIDQSPVSKEEFLDLMRDLIGEELFRRYYL